MFGPLEDPRSGNAERHAFHDILVSALCTVRCGGGSCSDTALFGRSKREFLESFLTLKNGIPSHDMSMAATLCTTAVSLFRINVRLSGRQKCHSVRLPWYQMMT